MTGSPEAQGFCVGCGIAITAAWEFCPRCGARRVDVEEAVKESPGPETYSSATRMRLHVKSLIDDGLMEEAERVVRLELETDRSLEVLLTAADVLSRNYRVNEAQDLLDESLALAPKNYLTHVRRSEHFARVGLTPQALESLNRARRFLPATDLAALVYCQELDRALRQRNSGSFVRGSSAPRLFTKLFSLRKRETAAPAEGRLMQPEVR